MKMNAKQKAKVEKEYKEFVDAVVGLSVEDLKNRILAFVGNREETIKAKENDTQLKNAVESVKQYSAPYKDTLKAIDLKVKYLHDLIQEKGGSL